MDMEMQVEPIVSRDEIRRLAFEAAERQKPLQQVNPYPEGTRARSCFEFSYWERERELNGETYA